MNASSEQAKTKSVWEYSLARRKVMEVREDYRFNEPAQIAEFVRGLGLTDTEQEHFLSIMLDAKNGIKGYSVVTVGLVDRTQIHSREVYRNAIIQGASRVVLAHNHPSNDPTPSAQDIAATRQLVESGKIIGIEVLDHVVVAQPTASGRGFASFRELNLM